MFREEASCLLTVATVHGTEGRLDDALRVAKEIASGDGGLSESSVGAFLKVWTGWK